MSPVNLTVVCDISPDAMAGDTHVWARTFDSTKITLYSLDTVIFFWILFNLDHDSIRMFCATGRVFLFMGESFLQARAVTFRYIPKRLLLSMTRTVGQQSACHTS